MNPLEQYLLRNNLDPIQAMNSLQSAGIISDNAVMAADVAEADVYRAIDYLATTVIQ